MEIYSPHMASSGSCESWQTHTHTHTHTHTLRHLREKCFFCLTINLLFLWWLGNVRGDDPAPIKTQRTLEWSCQSETYGGVKLKDVSLAVKWSYDVICANPSMHTQSVSISDFSTQCQRSWGLELMTCSTSWAAATSVPVEVIETSGGSWWRLKYVLMNNRLVLFV